METMCCPTLTELPPPPPNKTGWPWTEETPALPPTMPDGSPWLKISIVTPSFNQAQFIEETIRSVLRQGYPNLEYIIIDGGSTDGSVDIIKKYEPWLSYWISEKDRGQSYAINKGLSQSTGELLAYINSDDYYLPGTFNYAASQYKLHRFQFLAGDCFYVDENNEILNVARGRLSCLVEFLDLSTYEISPGITQPGVFWTRSVYRAIGEFREDLYYNMDYEYWLRALYHGFKIQYSDHEFAFSRMHSGQKTANQVPWFMDDIRIATDYLHHYKQKLSYQEQIRIWRGIRWFQSKTFYLQARQANSFNKAILAWLRGLIVDLPGSLASKESLKLCRNLVRQVIRRKAKG